MAVQLLVFMVEEERVPPLWSRALLSMMGGVIGSHQSMIVFTALRDTGTDQENLGVAKLYGTKSGHLAIRLDEYPSGVTLKNFDDVIHENP